MAYDAYSGGGEDLAGGSLRPFENEFNSFDPRMPSARFDSSFRAPDDFSADHFQHDDESKDSFDDFKAASNGYEHPPPIYEHQYDDESVQGVEIPPPYTHSFDADSESAFPQSADYSAPDYSAQQYSAPNNLNGTGYGGKELDEDFFAQEVPTESNGAVLPPPDEMQAEEGLILREWKRQNALRLEEKERSERQKLQQIVDDADDYKSDHIAKRQVNRESQVKNNREKEKVFLANQENFHKNADKAYWKAVTELIPNELPASLEVKGRGKDKDKKIGVVANKGPKPGKPTDLGRMRQVLLKLKHNPPAHMLPPPPPPATPAPSVTPTTANGAKSTVPAATPPSAAPATPETPPQADPVTA